jgi:sugar fermentation stimulation protein A
MVLFVVQGLRADRFVPDIHNDPAFALALRRAAERGVEVRAASVACTPEGVATLDRLEVPVDFAPVAAAEQDVGSYLLHLHVPEPRAVTVGSLGRHRLEPGHYLYVGSAMGRLSARIRRHLGRRKKPHWHVDHLRSVSATARAYPIYSLTRLECSLAAEVGALYPQPVAGFGASDCRCPSHLFYSREDPRRDPRFVELLLRFRHSLGLAGTWRR